MSDEARSVQAAALVSRAHDSQANGDVNGACASLEQAILLYAYQDSEEISELWARAKACELYGDLLTNTDRHAVAANVYQEAADLFARIATPESEHEAQSCARKILAAVASLRSQPEQRLYLLIAHYERLQQQASLDPGTEARQAAYAEHMARIFQRRDRPSEAVRRYEEAIQLYRQADPSPEIYLSMAECHHRAAGLLERSLNDRIKAMEHYRSAAVLYAEHEPSIYGRQAGKEIVSRALRALEQEDPS